MKLEFFGPFTRVPVELDSYGLDPYTYRVFVHVLRRGQCFASLKSIAALCSMSVRQVQHAFKVLESKKMVEKTERRGKTNIYTATPPEYWKQPDYSEQYESAQDYFNQAIMRRERKDFQGAFDDLARSLELYEQELAAAKQEGRQAIRKQRDIIDTQNEILRLTTRPEVPPDLKSQIIEFTSAFETNAFDEAYEPTHELIECEPTHELVEVDF